VVSSDVASQVLGPNPFLARVERPKPRAQAKCVARKK
jgi:hypothetical protein